MYLAAAEARRALGGEGGAALAEVLARVRALPERQDGAHVGVAEVEEGLSASENVEQALFRVAQEALSNVARHSRAGKVTVTLAGEKDEVILTVEDNGAGFDPEHAAKGVGLDSMRERLEAVGGLLEVSSQRKKGRRIVARAGRS